MAPEPNPMVGKRIVIALGGLRLGGAERQALHLAHHLQAIGADVRVLGMGEPGRVPDLCDAAGIPWRSLPGFCEAWRQRRRGLRRVVDWGRAGVAASENAIALVRYAWELRQERPDIILAYTIRPNVACALTWRIAGVRACVWGQRDEGRLYFGARTERWAMRRATAFVANAQVGADYLIKRCGVTPQQVCVIHNGVCLDPPVESAAAWRERLGIQPERFIACMVANLHESKDHATLLRAWRIVCQRTTEGALPPVLLLAGAFRGTETALKALAFDLGLGETVRFLGPVEDIAGLLSAVDLGVLSSRSEGLPNAVLECMAAGLPVVATDIPGVREALGNEAVEHLAPTGDAEALAERVLALIGSPVLRETVGAANRLRVERAFTLERMCTEMTEVMVSLLTKDRRAERDDGR